jgi:glyoxylase-like metal-dependent hydrolase (beta-lactamase superfamily II)
MIFRQLFDESSYTYTYLIADENTKEACLIDPVLEKGPLYAQLLEELDLKLTHALDTHVHADHVTALGGLRDKYNCITMVGTGNEVECANSGLAHNQEICIGQLKLTVLFTPGHTSDSFCFYLETNNERYVFTGDTLLIRGTGRTDFQNGNPEDLYNSLNNIVLALPEDTWVYPGHDYKGWMRSTIAEEKQHNPRINLPTKAAFIDHMNNLNLPDPKMMDIAVPANLSCGKK